MKFVLYRYYRYSDLLDRLNESRAEHLMEQSSLALASPDDVTNLHTAMVAADMLDCLVVMLRHASQIWNNPLVRRRMEHALLLSDPKHR